MLYVDIKKKLGNFVLDIQLQTYKDTLALLGASGCGKTMTLKCIAGIEKPDEGEIVLEDKILFSSKKGINLSPQKRKLGLLFQNYALFPNMTLEENIAIAIPKDCSNKKEKIQAKIKEFSLVGLERHYPHQLSGGQQQRTAIARMLVNEPRVLMLDEPFSALDEHLRWKMEQGLIAALKDYGKSALYVSHNKDEVYRIVHRIAILKDGRVHLAGTKDEVFKKPRDIDTAKLIGCKNISKAQKIDANKVHAVDWGFELDTEQIVDDSIKYVAVFSDNLDIVENKTRVGDNIFPFAVINKIANPFSHSLVLVHAKGEISSYKSKIYLDLDSPMDYSRNGSLEGNVYVQFKKDELLLLY